MLKKFLDSLNEQGSLVFTVYNLFLGLLGYIGEDPDKLGEIDKYFTFVEKLGDKELSAKTKEILKAWTLIRQEGIMSAEISQEELVSFLETIQVKNPGCFQTSFPRFLLSRLSHFWDKFKSAEQDSMASPFTKKRKIQDTSTSTIAVPTQAASVDVQDSEDCDSSDDLDESFFTALPSQKTSGITGCNISVQRTDGSYTWRSDKLMLLAKYIDLKIYPDVKKIRKCSSLDAWREANFRAKICIAAKDKEVNECLSKLKHLLLQRAAVYPAVLADSVPATKRK